MDEFRKEYYLQAIRELSVNLSMLWYRLKNISPGGGEYPLPDNYEYGEAIIANGSAELVTDISLTNADVLEISYKSSIGSRAYNLLGAYSGASSENNFSLYVGTTAPKGYYRFNGQVQRADIPNDAAQHITSWGQNGIFFDGVKILDSFEAASPFTSTFLYVCSLANSSQNKFNGYIYEIKIKRNGKIIHDLKPCGQWVYSGGGVYEEGFPAFFDTKTGRRYDCGAGFTVYNLENYPEE